MQVSNRYLVWWDSALTGRHYETAQTPERADRILEEKERREFFERGAVFDTAQWTQSPQEFRARHDEYVSA